MESKLLMNVSFKPDSEKKVSLITGLIVVIKKVTRSTAWVMVLYML